MFAGLADSLCLSFGVDRAHAAGRGRPRTGDGRHPQCGHAAWRRDFCTSRDAPGTTVGRPQTPAGNGELRVGTSGGRLRAPHRRRTHLGPRSGCLCHERDGLDRLRRHARRGGRGEPGYLGTHLVRGRSCRHRSCRRSSRSAAASRRRRRLEGGAHHRDRDLCPGVVADSDGRQRLFRLKIEAGQRPARSHDPPTGHDTAHARWHLPDVRGLGTDAVVGRSGRGASWAVVGCTRCGGIHSRLAPSPGNRAHSFSGDRPMVQSYGCSVRLA